MTVKRDIRPVGEGDSLIFDAVLYPHRSLSPTGFWIVMGIVAGVSFAAGAAAVAIGAWPVFGFFGADVLLLAWCFRRNYWDARLYETVQLTPDALTVRRVLPTGKTRSWTFQPHWLRVELEEPIDRASQLALASHGYRLSIGAFLSPDEKRDFARALGTALQRARAPGVA
ncbi:putative membrane protein [Constrictibacter sp. MBR-5]|jgi:uncharacterized membrane protein